MRSDPADRAGASAADGYAAARDVRRWRRLVQAGLLGSGLAGAVVVPALDARAASAMAGLLGAWMARPAPDAARWLRGAAGEQATAALLEGLPPRRWLVFHDRRVPGSAANIDHVAIGPTGVWMIDTKTYRAPLRAGWRSVRAGDHAVDTGPAAWEASVLTARLGIEVRPLLAVHGEGLPTRGRLVHGVRVLPAAAVVRRLRLRRHSARLRREEVAALGEELDRAFPPAATATGRSRRPVRVSRRGRP